MQLKVQFAPPWFWASPSVRTYHPGNTRLRERVRLHIERDSPKAMEFGH